MIKSLEAFSFATVRRKLELLIPTTEELPLSVKSPRQTWRTTRFSRRPACIQRPMRTNVWKISLDTCGRLQTVAEGFWFAGWINLLRWDVLQKAMFAWRGENAWHSRRAAARLHPHHKCSRRCSEQAIDLMLILVSYINFYIHCCNHRSSERRDPRGCWNTNSTSLALKYLATVPPKACKVLRRLWPGVRVWLTDTDSWASC